LVVAVHGVVSYSFNAQVLLQEAIWVPPVQYELGGQGLQTLSMVALQSLV